MTGGESAASPHNASKFVVEKPGTTHTQLCTILTVLNTAPSHVHANVNRHTRSIHPKDLTAQIIQPEARDAIGIQAMANLTTITDNEDGTYKVTCFVQAEGAAAVHILHSGKHIWGSPMPLEAQLLGTPLQHLGQRGTCEGQLNSPYDIALDEDGSIFVADTGNHRVQVFDSSGCTQRLISYTLQGKAIKPTSIAVHPDGRVAIADYNHKCVRVFNRSGQHLRSFRAPANTGIAAQPGNGSEQTRAIESYGMTFNAVSSQLLVTDYNERCVLGFTMDGKHAMTIEGSSLYTSSYHQSRRHLHGPLGIDTDHDGNIYVADFGQHGVHVFSPSGELLYRFGSRESDSAGVAGNMQRPWGICVEGSGHLVISEHDGNCLSIFSSDGHLLHRLPSSGPTTLQGPAGIAMDAQGRIWVTDRGGHCAKLF